MMIVSIIIPNFNGEAFLGECLDSCLQQGECVKEIIVVDDHSTDNSWNVLRNYAERFPDLIKIFKNRDKGACKARNYGFELSSGEYIQWLDSDDFLGQNKLKAQLNDLAGIENTISFSRTIHYYQYINGKVKQVEETNSCLASSEEPSEFLLKLWGGLDFQAATIQTGAWLVPRSVSQMAGIWNESLLRDQDGEYFTRAVLQSKRLIYSKAAKTFYRKIEKGKSITQTNSVSFFRSELDAINLKCQYLASQQESDLFKRAFAKQYLILAVSYYGRYGNLYKEAWERYQRFNYKISAPQLGGPVLEGLKKAFGWKLAKRAKLLISELKR